MPLGTHELRTLPCHRPQRSGVHPQPYCLRDPNHSHRLSHWALLRQHQEQGYRWERDQGANMTRLLLPLSFQEGNTLLGVITPTSRRKTLQRSFNNKGEINCYDCPEQLHSTPCGQAHCHVKSHEGFDNLKATRQCLLVRPAQRACHGTGLLTCLSFALGPLYRQLLFTTLSSLSINY